MIITVTLNPSIDYILQIKNLALKETQRAENKFLYAAGKGVNVSRVLTRLNIPTTAWGFLGGLNGDRFIKLLEEEGINTNFIPCEDETRLNVIITEIETHKQLRISAKGPLISKDELNILYNKARNLPEGIEFVSFGGSLPQDVNDDIYMNLIDIIQSNGIRCILDTSNEALIKGIQAKPFMIKPNLYELGQIVKNENIKTIEDIKKEASRIIRSGVENVIVSLAEDGAIYVNESKIIHSLAPKVNVKSAVGAGDSMIAGLIYALHNNLSDEDMIKYGLAFGSASVLTKGTELAHWHDVENLFPKVEIISIENNNYI